MSIQIRDRKTGMCFEIPFEFILNQRKGMNSNQICEFYLQGDHECTYGSSCKKLHIDRDYFENHVVKKILNFIQDRNDNDSDDGIQDIPKEEYEERKNIKINEIEEEIDGSSIEKSDDNHSFIKKRNKEREGGVSFTIRIDAHSRRRNEIQKRFRPFFHDDDDDDKIYKKRKLMTYDSRLHINNPIQKRIEKYRHQMGANQHHRNINGNKKICIYERVQECEEKIYPNYDDEKQILMEVKYDALLPTQGKEIAAHDLDGTYRLQICKYFQKDKHCLDGRKCYFAHLDM